MNIENTPYIAIGNDELGDFTEIIECPRCNSIHNIEYGTSRTLLPNGTWSEPKESKTTGFYKCGDDLYLGTINGRKLK